MFIKNIFQFCNIFGFESSNYKNISFIFFNWYKTNKPFQTETAYL